MTGKKLIPCLAGLTAGLCLLLLFIFPVRPARAGASVTPDTIRVGLARQVPEVSFFVTGTYQLVDSATGQSIGTLTPGNVYTVLAGQAGLKLSKNGQAAGNFTGPLLLQESQFRGVATMDGAGTLLNRGSGDVLHALGASNQMVEIPDPTGLYVLGAGGQKQLQPAAGGLNLIDLSFGGSDRRYRGSMEFRVDGSGVTAINVLPMEDYLYGVVPAEMPASWPAEALKAQAVAARSYALDHLGAYAREGFDVLATQSSQVYRGYDGENPATTRAVNETQGVVMTYQGQPINAVFHSCDGGFTENSEDVWNSYVPYLRTKVDPYDKNDHLYNWKVTYSNEQLRQQLSKAGYKFKTVNDLKILAYTASGARVKCLEVTGTGLDGRPLTVNIGEPPDRSRADAVRAALGLKSALFKMDKIMSDSSGSGNPPENNTPPESGNPPVDNTAPNTSGQGGSDTGTSGGQTPPPAAGGQNLPAAPKLISVTFTGNGWGHGLGMSQYGARGMAQQGYNYKQILEYYYTGISITPNYGG